jgi:hypothetical protein
MTDKPPPAAAATGEPPEDGPARRARRPPLKRALVELAETFRHAGLWIISGSIAMGRHGLKTFPDDIDIWCGEETLRDFASIANAPVLPVETEYFRTNAVHFTLAGWPVEVVGAVRLPNGATQVVDENMLGRAEGSPPAESAEDLIADYMAIDRHRPKDDRRVSTLVTLNAHRLDWDYLLRRTREWNVKEESVERLLRPHLPGARPAART